MGERREKAYAKGTCLIGLAVIFFSHNFVDNSGARGATAPVALRGADDGEGAKGPWVAQVDAAVTAFQEVRYREALELFQAAFREAEQGAASPEWKGRILRGVGAALAGMGSYRRAMEYYLLARSFTVQGGNKEHLAILDSNMANVHVFQGDLEPAVRLYRRALRGLEGGGANTRAQILHNLAVVALRQRRYQAALGPLGEALELAAEPYTQAWVHDHRGLAYLGLRDFARARESFGRSIEIRRAMGSNANLTRPMMFLGRVELERGDADSAIRQLSEAARLAEQRDSPTDLWAVYYYRSQAQRALGQTDGAIADLRRAVEVMESIRAGVVPTDSLRVQFEVRSEERRVGKECRL